MSATLMSATVVLKFGSSVLRSAADLPAAVHEVYRELRGNRRVIAVVSAFAGATNELLAIGQQSAAEPDGHALAALVATGEQQVAAQLALALDLAGVPARVADPRELGLRAQGEPLDATPYALDAEWVRASLEQPAVLVVPGFIACDANNRTVLLGRGGSDLTALFIAQRLNARCRLVKDVNGIYERDPARHGPRPRRFSHLSWDEALRVGGALVQPKAIRFAQLHRRQFEVAAAGSVDASIVGDFPGSLVEAAAADAPLRVVLLGLGTVGLGVYRHLARLPEFFDVRRIAVRDPARHRHADVPAQLLSTDLLQAIDEPAELVIETMGGIGPAADAVKAALARGRTVVTANKALMALHWQDLASFTAGSPPRLRYSAAAGGAVPVLEVLETLRQEEPIAQIRAVINGTCNFVLDSMMRGVDLQAAVSEAQSRGFAEADPRSDLNGEDAACKLRLLAQTAFGHGIQQHELSLTGIERFTPATVADARRHGRILRQVASCRIDNGRLDAAIGPRALPNGDYLAGARGEENRIEILTAAGNCIRMAGKGAGRWPTAMAVMGDVLAHFRAVQLARRGAPIQPFTASG